MRRGLFQYGTAAHLAVLTAAPLFLFAFTGTATHAIALTALTLAALIWTVMNPAARAGELQRDARRRIGAEIARDPFLAFSVAVLILLSVAAVNGGIALAYDAASSLWYLREPLVPVLPASVSGCGTLPLAGFFGVAAVYLGVRHALGGRERRAYLLVAGVLAAAAVLSWKALPSFGFKPVSLAATPGNPFGAGSLLGVYFLLTAVAWSESWLSSKPVAELVAAAAGAVLLAGLMEYAPLAAFWAFVPAAVLAAAGGILPAAKRRSGADWLRTAVSFTILVSPVAFLLTGGARPKFWPVFTEEFLALRKAASAIAVEAWKNSTHLGAGAGAYPLALGFHASPEDWKALAIGQTAAPDGWVHFLFERGFLGAAMFLAGLALALRDLILRFVRAGSAWSLGARHLLGPLALAAVAAFVFTDCSFMQLEALMAPVAALALSAASLPDPSDGEDDHG